MTPRFTPIPAKTPDAKASTPTDGATNSTAAGGPDLAVEITALNKTYRTRDGGKQALTDMNLAIPRGCIYGLLGPNGAGKSTLINILAGTVIKTSGTAHIWGVDIDENPRQSRANIGIVPQELNIDAFFTPRETLEMMAGLFGVPRHERRTDEILEEIGLSDKANAYARTLSGGMRRRLLIGKAMVHQPPVLVLDEPTAGVDVDLRQRLWQLVREMNAAGVTIILTTHYLEEAEALCDRVAIINHGKLIAEDNTADLLKGMGSKSLVLMLDDAPARLPETLISMGGSLDGNTLRITFAPDETSAGAILTHVKDAGLTVTDISTEEPNLEDVFLDLTRRG